MIQTVAELLHTAVVTLRETSPTARLDAELLLAHVLNWSRARLLAERDHRPDPAQVAMFRAMLARRSERVPVAYLIGQKEFYGLNFKVTADVLVPRPETELLVELALEAARSYPAKLKLAEIGTGSAAIITALALALPEAMLYATDLSAAALAIAATNLAQHGLSARVDLLQGDLLAPLPEPVDIIVSNPPYTILSAIEPGVYQHEPHLALDGGGPDGADLYRRLIPALATALRPGGSVLFEIGAWQGPTVIALLRSALPQAQISLAQDLASHDRVVTARLPS